MVEILDWDELVIEAKRRRAAEGLSQVAHAELAEVSRDTIRSFDRFEKTVSLEKALAILSVVGLAVKRRNEDGSAAHEAFVRNARERWNRLTLDLPADHPSRIPLGRAEYDYELLGSRPISLTLLEKLLKKAPAKTGWQPFHVFSKTAIRPVVEAGELESWIGKPDPSRFFTDSSSSDYWRVAPEGHFFLIRGYQEDGMDSQEPGTFMDVGLPIWRIADVVDHALWMASELKATGVSFAVRWDGLQGRRLVNWARPTTKHPTVDGVSSKVATARGAVRMSTDESDVAYHDIISTLIKPLYDVYGVRDVDNLVADELKRRASKSHFPAMPPPTRSRRPR